MRRRWKFQLNKGLMSKPSTKFVFKINLPDDPIKQKEILDRLNDKEKLKEYLNECGFEVIDSNVSVE